MSSKKFNAWIIWLIASFFYAFQYILRVIPSIMITDIMTKFNIDAAVFGQFSGIYYLGYSLAHIPLGLLLDRLGPKKVLPLFITLTVIGTLPLVVTDFWVYPIFGRFLVGVGSSSAILGVFKIVRIAFGEKRFPLMLSWSVTIGLMGAIYGGEPINYLQGIIGFEKVIIMLIVLGLVLAVIAYFVIPTIEEEKVNNSIWHDIKIVLSNKRAVAICVLAGFMVGPLEGFADVWGSTFLQTVYGFDNAVAATLPSFIFIGMACGGPILSFIAGRIQNYLLVIFLSGLIMALAFVLLLTGSLSVFMVSVLFTGIGMLCAYQILAIYAASTFVPKNVAGLTSAVANMIIMTFGYVFHSSIGGVIDMFSSREGYSPLDSASALAYGIWVIPAGLFIGSLGYGILLLTSARRPPLPD